MAKKTIYRAQAGNTEDRSDNGDVREKERYKKKEPERWINEGHKL